MYRMSEEALGWFIVATLYRRFSSMVLPSEHPVGGGLGVLGSCRGGTTDLHHDYDHTHRLSITTPSLATQSRKGSIGNVAVVKCIFSSHKPSHSTHTNQLLHGDESNSTCTAPTTKNNPVESNMIEDETTGISSNFFSSGKCYCHIDMLRSLTILLFNIILQMWRSCVKGCKVIHCRSH